MKNEVAVVMGVGPGLGAALVKRFAKEGFTTIAVARRASSLTSLRGGDDPVILYDCDATRGGPNHRDSRISGISALL
jgi:NAD(P)-dependent dehydrogenase (short-subunit alcohol dehydrogenase family)